MKMAAPGLGLKDTDFENIFVAVEMDREGDRIMVNLEVSGTAQLICDRTSEPFAQEVRGTHSLIFVPYDRVDVLNDGTDDVLGFEPSDTSIDVTEITRDTLVLSVPIRKIAPGAEEIEITTRFGDSGQDIDPRWEQLRGLSDQD
ncbi:MAG: hypothetical protein ACI80V_000833 [Rhodothermales bacterium]|jgi:uncharacterized protein